MMKEEVYEIKGDDLKMLYYDAYEVRFAGLIKVILCGI